MKNFLELCYYEQKKLFQSNATRRALLGIVAITIFLNLHPLTQRNQVAYLDENGQIVVEEMSYYREVQLERKFARQYNRCALTNEIAHPARELDIKYQEYTSIGDGGFIPLMNTRLPLRSLVNLGVNPYIENPVDTAYEIMLENQADRCPENTEDYWAQKRSEIDLPFVMHYARGFQQILSMMHWPLIMSLFFIVFCLCRIFSEEVAYRTSPLLRTTKAGTTKSTIAKLVVGEMIAVGTILLLLGITAVIQFAIHGTGGAEAPIQILDPIGQYPLSYRSSALTASGAVLMVVAVALQVAAFLAALTMLLSQLLQHTIPVLVIPLGGMLLSLVFSRTGELYSIYAQKDHILSFFPIQRLNIENLLLDERLVNLFGTRLNAVEMSAILYGGLTIIFLSFCILLCRATVKDRN